MRPSAAIAALLAVLLLPLDAHAQECQPGAFRQDDMAGVYESAEAQMRLSVFPCGGTHLLWSNAYGTHQAVYYGEERLPSGSIVARLAEPDPFVRSLDGRNNLGFKPAEPGYIQIITIGPFGEDGRIYRLRKMR